MKWINKAIICSLTSTTLFFTAKAQMPVMEVANITVQEDKKAVVLQSMDIDVKVTGNIATTVMKMVFRNNSSRVLEGELTFPMPDGVTVSRYAIDINGKMREAVPVEKAKATEVFESIEHRRVDPGLLEKIQGNNFRTRIYPLPAMGSRIVLIGYEQELKMNDSKALQYYLPLAANTVIPEFHLKTTVAESAEKPVLAEQPDGSFNFSGTGNFYTAEMRQSNFKPQKPLLIYLPKTTGVPETAMQPAGDSYYFLVNAYPKDESRARQWSNHMALIWDVSLSGLQRNTKKEMELLDKLVQQKQNLTIELGLLNNRFTKAGTYTITNGNWQELKNRLQSVIYDGGTDYSSIPASFSGADEFLFFTDGLSTFGKDSIVNNHPFYCISSSASADYSNLKFISQKNGGQFVNLSVSSVDEALTALSRQTLQFIGIKKNDDVSEVYPSMPQSVNGQITIAGISSEKATTLVLQFGYGGHVTMEKIVQLKTADNKETAIDISRVWAQKKIAEMDIRYELNKDDINDLGKQFGIVTRNTSLIVLESVADYVRYEILPPAELRAEYEMLVKTQAIEKEQRFNNLLEQSFSMMDNLKTWWNKVFTPKKYYPKPGNNYPPPPPRPDDNGRFEEEKIAVTSQVGSADAGVVMAPTQNAAAPAKSLQGYIPGIAVEKEAEVDKGFFDSKKMEDSQLSEVTLTRQRQSGIVNENTRETAVRSTEIKTVAFKSDQVYMKKFAAIKPAQAYQTYLALRKDYISTPLFYFDVANWFYQNSQPDTALMILSNMADLSLENAEVYKILAYKLKETDNYPAEIFITKKIVEWRPMDPQSHRDYALALADGGFYQEALDVLYSVLNQSYSPEAGDRDDGIEEIIMAEINQIITLHSSIFLNKINTMGIRKELISSMPVDVRVVLNWNKQDTDIDLWVTDPNGEKCFYSNSETSAGGRISNDFTSGYGPEQFMLKKAVKGKYKIEVNYYGENQLSMSGATTVMAEIFTRYASGQQQRKIITLQMPKVQKDGVLVGTFNF